MEIKVISTEDSHNMKRIADSLEQINRTLRDAAMKMLNPGFALVAQEARPAFPDDQFVAFDPKKGGEHESHS